LPRLAPSSFRLHLATSSKKGYLVRTLLPIFVSIFIAELGDKTQLATLLFATDKNHSRLGVFLAASSALVCSSLLAVLVGSQLTHILAPPTLQAIAGVGFIIIGVWLLVGIRI
jgi:putative Ca2+/H+ antiporter (TMEM165/GDT1 family)